MHVVIVNVQNSWYELQKIGPTPDNHPILTLWIEIPLTQWESSVSIKNVKTYIKAFKLVS